MHVDAQGRQTLIAYVEVVSDLPGRAPAVNSVCDLCAERLKPYELNSLVLAVKDWPRTASGAIDRQKLPPPPAELLAEASGD